MTKEELNQQKKDIEKAWRFIHKYCTYVNTKKNIEVCMVNKDVFFDYMKDDNQTLVKEDE